MKTSVEIDRELLQEALALSGLRTKKAVVNEALAECVRVRKQAGIIDLFGKIDFDPEYDYKSRRGLA